MQPPGHTDPYFYGWTAGTSQANQATVARGEDTGHWNTTHSGTTYRLRYTGEGNSHLNMIEHGLADQVDDITGELGMYEIGFVCHIVGARGQRGAVSDLWWGPTDVASTGDTFPVDASDRQFVQMGVYVFPWTGDSTIPVTI